MKIRILKPKEIKKEHLKQIIHLVASGEQVNQNGLQEKLLHADLIAYKLQGNTVIATATLKNPLQSYKTRVFNSANVPQISRIYDKELGYIITNPDFENNGHCQDLLKRFFSKIASYNQFATTRKPSMAHILGKFGFVKTGKKYKTDLELLIYNAMK